MNFIPDPNPEGLIQVSVTMPRNVLTFTAFVANSPLSPVVPWLPCPVCQGQGIVGDDQANEDCPACSGSGEVPIGLHDAIMADRAERAWDM